MGDPERHTNVKFEEDLECLHATLLKMGGLVEQQIGAPIGSLVKRDPARARETIARDVEVNRLDIEVDDRCIQLIALYQPAAVDLRLITTALKITTDLERIGDNAVNICERVLELSQGPELKLYRDIPRMVVIAQSMVRDSIEAFTRRTCGLQKSLLPVTMRSMPLTARSIRNSHAAWPRSPGVFLAPLE
jgi:phosphate transport system protein